MAIEAVRLYDVAKPGNVDEKKGKKMYFWDFPGGLVGKTLHSHCRGPGFNP